MKKTLNISLAGFSFTIEETAYHHLNAYLNALRYPLEKEEVDEVMRDIEIRIVEIFNSRLNGKNVIDENDVNVVIDMLGKPEEIDASHETDKEKASDSTNSQNQFEEKRLYRDPENKKLGGVCSGLSYYLRIDVVIIRILFIVLAVGAGIGILPYIILWIIIPEAKSNSDFLKMKGKPITFENIKDQGKKMADETLQGARNLFNGNKKKVDSIGRSFLRFLSITFGIFSILLALSFYLSAFVLLTGASVLSPQLLLARNLEFYLGNGILSTGITISLLISFLLPAIYFTLLALRLLASRLKIRFMNWVFSLTIVAWITTFAFIGVALTKMNYPLDGVASKVENFQLEDTSNVLQLKQYDISIPSGFSSYWRGIYSDKKTIFHPIETDVYSIKIDSLKHPQLVMKLYGKGYNQPITLNVPVKIHQNQISFPNYYSYPYVSRLRKHRIKYILYVPGKTQLLANENIDIHYVESYQLSIESDDDDFFDTEDLFFYK